MYLYQYSVSFRFSSIISASLSISVDLSHVKTKLIFSFCSSPFQSLFPRTCFGGELGWAPGRLASLVDVWRLAAGAQWRSGSRLWISGPIVVRSDFRSNSYTVKIISNPNILDWTAVRLEVCRWFPFLSFRVHCSASVRLWGGLALREIASALR